MSDDAELLADIKQSLRELDPSDSDDALEIEEPPEEDDYSPHLFTLDLQKKFLEEFAKTCNISAAARVAGVHRDTIYLAKERSERFRSLFETAREIAVDRLEGELRDWAVNGKVTYEEYDEDGNLVAQRTDYSEKGLIKLLEAHRSEKFDSNDPDSLQGDITIEVHPQDNGSEKEVVPEEVEG